VLDGRGEFLGKVRLDLGGEVLRGTHGKLTLVLKDTPIRLKHKGRAEVYDL
jgi:hypothetical protein